MNLPIAVTLARLLAAPLILHLIVDGAYWWAFLVFAAAGLSDAVDGALAKLLGQHSRAGRILDPLADKALIVSVYVALGMQGAIAQPVVVLVVLRDVLIVCGAALMFALGAPLVERAAQVSRVNTALQIALVTLVLADLALRLGLAGPARILGYAVIATTVASGIWYLVWCGRRLLRLEGAR